MTPRGTQCTRHCRHVNDPAAPVMLVYTLFMLSGQTALDDLQNARYPDIEPELFTDIAARALATPLTHTTG